MSLSCSDWTRLRPTPRPKPSQIPGLVEAILLQLLLRDLLHTQRVCHLWKATTEQSSILQRKLFFQPVSDPDHRPEFNPLPEAGFTPFFRLNQEEWKASAFYEAVDWYYKDKALQQALLRPGASWSILTPISLCGISRSPRSGVCERPIKNVILGEVGNGGTLAARKRVFLCSSACGGLRLWPEREQLRIPGVRLRGIRAAETIGYF